MTLEFTVSAIIPASPETIYEAWLDSDGHTKMTGSPAHATANVGGAFDAWDGYISGKNLELKPGERIVQSWRGQATRTRMVIRGSPLSLKQSRAGPK